MLRFYNYYFVLYLKKYRKLSENEFEIITENIVGIPMRDGTILGADITHSKDSGKF